VLVPAGTGPAVASEAGLMHLGQRTFEGGPQAQELLQVALLNQPWAPRCLISIWEILSEVAWPRAFCARARSTKSPQQRSNRLIIDRSKGRVAGAKKETVALPAPVEMMAVAAAESKAEGQ